MINNLKLKEMINKVIRIELKNKKYFLAILIDLDSDSIIILQNGLKKYIPINNILCFNETKISHEKLKQLENRCYH